MAILEIAVLVSDSAEIGAGHFKRQLALAGEAVSRGFEVTFVGQFSRHAVKQIESLGIRTVALPTGEDPRDIVLKSFSDTAVEVGRCVVIVDDYDLLGKLEGLVESFENLVVFSDGHPIEACPSLLVDSARSEVISELGATSRQLIGARAAIISKEYSRIREFRRIRASHLMTEGSILVSFGGSDPSDRSYEFLVACENLRANADFDLVLGALYGGKVPLQTGYERSGMSISIDLEGEYVSSLKRCKAAIGAAGLSAYERAHMGIPSLIVSVAENQDGIARILCDSGAAFLTSSPLSEESISRFLETIDMTDDYLNACAAGLDLVDGLGAARVLDEMEKLGGIRQ